MHLCGEDIGRSSELPDNHSSEQALSVSGPVSGAVLTRKTLEAGGKQACEQTFEIQGDVPWLNRCWHSVIMKHYAAMESEDALMKRSLGY